MAKTIDEAFRLLRSRLEITDLQEQTVSTRQTKIREALEKDLSVLDTFLTGSYRRNTMIAPLAEADIDIFVVLDPRYYSANGQQQLLEIVRSSLLKTYTRTPKIRPDGHAVTVTFTDFKVDVVPGFYAEGGGYLIPDTELQRWIRTDPKEHVVIWTAANKAHNGDLVPLLKMLKSWNKSRALFKSFHLETIALTALKGVRIDSFPSGLRYVFDAARAMIRVKLPDPAGYSDDVGAHVSSEAAMQNLIGRLDWAHAQAREAEQLAAAGRIEEAFTKWAALLKGYFPTYG
ncbi:CBASS oligonucleotide cyclase [Methylocystis iwaonis]|jgi:predicted nucleotidyltransferase|uniref:Nucleotidyltransferase n=1 Tax=Methylocystis iwaonis TaxID=2885079 RepID=A0ABM8EF65_9HYPH|nr:CBASS oligonucleotide cyclase [Methylocystis iwaonis]BDV36601.1 hypothetical protein SS37A_41310 [Methylocystis iwaonis]